jgi:hypothetical protein
MHMGVLDVSARNALACAECGGPVALPHPDTLQTQVQVPANVLSLWPFLLIIIGDSSQNAVPYHLHTRLLLSDPITTNTHSLSGELFVFDTLAM